MTHSIDYPDWEDDALDCDHDGYERDILTGVATCYQCGARWSMSSDEFKRSLAAQAAYDIMVAEMEDEACPDCGGEGIWDDECECQSVVDTCCCLDPTPRTCSTCKGEGTLAPKAGEKGEGA